MLRLVFILFIVPTSFSWGDVLKFGSVELNEIEQGIWHVKFRYSEKTDQLPNIFLLIDPACLQNSPQHKQSLSNGKDLQWFISCPISQPKPSWLEVAGITSPSAQVYFQFTDRNGHQSKQLSTNGHFRWEPNTTLNNKVNLPILNYVTIGIRHIFSGADHLSLILLMLFMVAGRSKNIKTLFQIITAFTIGHSITLGLASFNLISINQQSVELMISLSIVILAAELIRTSTKNIAINHDNSVHPVMLTLAFGLIHGLGFASALQAIGLPDNNKLLALFFFNSGVEIGQLVFIIFILAIIKLGQRIPKLNNKINIHIYTKLISLYGIGALGVTWSVLRMI